MARVNVLRSIRRRRVRKGRRVNAVASARPRGTLSAAVARLPRRQHVVAQAMPIGEVAAEVIRSNGHRKED